MSCIRVLSLRQLPTQTVVVSRHSPSPPKHHAATRNFTSTRIRAFNPPQLPESVVKAVRNTKAWNAIGQNPELQQIFLETLQVLKDEGTSYFYLGCMGTSQVFRCRPSQTIHDGDAYEL